MTVFLSVSTRYEIHAKIPHWREKGRVRNVSSSLQAAALPFFSNCMKRKPIESESDEEEEEEDERESALEEQEEEEDVLEMAAALTSGSEEEMDEDELLENDNDDEEEEEVDPNEMSSVMDQQQQQQHDSMEGEGEEEEVQEVQARQQRLPPSSSIDIANQKASSSGSMDISNIPTTRRTERSREDIDAEAQLVLKVFDCLLNVASSTVFATTTRAEYAQLLAKLRETTSGSFSSVNQAPPSSTTTDDDLLNNLAMMLNSKAGDQLVGSV